MSEDIWGGWQPEFTRRIKAINGLLGTELRIEPVGFSTFIVVDDTTGEPITGNGKRGRTGPTLAQWLRFTHQVALAHERHMMERANVINMARELPARGRDGRL